MTTKAELMAGGMPGPLANRIGQDGPNTGLSATGSTQGDALALTATMSLFGTVNASTGCLLPNADGKPPYSVLNGGSNTLTVYPTGSQKINNTTSVAVPAGKSAIFIANGNQWLGNISA